MKTDPKLLAHALKITTFIERKVVVNQLRLPSLPDFAPLHEIHPE